MMSERPVAGLAAARPADTDGHGLVGLGDRVRGRQTGHRRSPGGRAQERRRTGRPDGHARAVAASPDAHAGRPRHPHRARRAAFRADAAGRGAQDRRARLGAGDADRVLRPGVLAQLGGDRLFAAKPARPASRRPVGMPVFDYLAQHPEEASYFSEAMVGFHGAEPPAVAEAYDFSGVQDRRGRRRRDRQHAGGDPLAAMPGRAACCSTGRMSCATRRPCSRHAASRSA